MTDIENGPRRIDLKISRVEERANRSVLRSEKIIGTIDSECDAKKIFRELWRGKWTFFLINVLFPIMGAFYALSLPNVYKSEGIYAISRQQAINTQFERYGGLAAMAGINIDSHEDTTVNQALMLLKSWPFIESFLSKYEMPPYLKAVKGWSENDQKVIWDEDLYDPVQKKWILDPESKLTFEPTSFETYESFVRMLHINRNAKTGLVTIAIEYYIPELTSKWIGLLVEEINTHFKNRDLSEARHNIEYFEKKISETSIAEMRSVFFDLIEVQTKKLMLAEVRGEYLFQTIASPKVAERKSKPRRLVIILLVTFSGLVLSSFILFWGVFRPTKE